MKTTAHVAIVLTLIVTGSEHFRNQSHAEIADAIRC